MSWGSIGNFNTIIGSGVRTRCLAVYNDELYCAIDVHPSFNPQVWKYDGVSWTLVEDTLWTNGFNDLHVFDGKLFGITYGGVSGGADGDEGIWMYNGTTWTHEMDTGIDGMSNSGGNFVEYGAELYAVERSNSSVWKRIVTGTWVLISDSVDAPAKQELGIYDGDMYLTGRVGSSLSGTNYIRIFSGGSFTTAVFTEASGGTADPSAHGIGKALAEFNGNLYSFDRHFIHEYNGSVTVLSNTFAEDADSVNGERDFIVFNGKLFTGRRLAVYVYDGATWAIDSHLIGYSQDTAVGAYDPPGQFAQFGTKLYCCAGPGHVYTSTEEAPPVSGDGYVKAIAISKSKAGDDRLWLTAWKPSRLFLRSYIADTLVAETEVSLGSALLSAVNAKTVIAYPYTPITGGDGRCIVYGRMLYNGEYRHVMLTTDAGDNFTIIEDGWEDDVCGALLVRLGQIYAIRNKTTESYLYKGDSELTYVSTIPFPVNPFAFTISPDNRALFVGCNIPGSSPRIMGAAFPFTTWVDITFNYPTAGEVNAIVAL